ncbi:hypothetical protein SEVIR_6G024102v4 [Setaria viridis]
MRSCSEWAPTTPGPTASSPHHGLLGLSPLGSLSPVAWRGVAPSSRLKSLAHHGTLPNSKGGTSPCPQRRRARPPPAACPPLPPSPPTRAAAASNPHPLPPLQLAGPGMASRGGDPPARVSR